jgi:hypothetical protein
MLPFSEDSFEDLAAEVALCLANIRDSGSTLQDAGPFYEGAAEALRGHAILRLLIDGDGEGFSNDLLMSAQARRGYLRRCAHAKYGDYFLALSRSSALFDAVAGDDVTLASEVFHLSPDSWRPGDEYEVDFCFQRCLGLHVCGSPAAALTSALEHFEKAAEGEGARLSVCHALHGKDPNAFESAFQAFLQARNAEIAETLDLADEQLIVALGTKVFVEGIAVLKIARRLGLPLAIEYPMCPALALIPRQPVEPEDEFAAP